MRTKQFLLILAAVQSVLLLCAVQVLADTDDEMLVWAENAVVKVRPQDTPKPMPSGIMISAARNEYEPFQIVIRGKNRPVRGLDVGMTDFLAGSGSRISCRTNCTVYRELYYNAVSPSGAYGSTGEWPDALIPKVDTYFGERRNAFPIDVPANRNQPVWIDVYVPPGTGPGFYTAYLMVQAQGERTMRIPVYLTVRGFTLPATSSIKNAFFLYSGALPIAHGRNLTGKALDALAKIYSKALLAHRLSNGYLLGGEGWVPTDLINPTPNSLANLKQDFGSFFDGTVLPNGAQVTAVFPYFTSCEDRTFCRPDVTSFLARAGWLSRIGIYLPDEPNLADPYVIQQIKSAADTAHQYGFKTLLTKSYSPTVASMTNIWVVPLPSLRNSIESGNYWVTYANEIARGKEVWVYQACFEHAAYCGWGDPWFPGLSGWPDYMIDMQGMKNRMQDWINWKYRVQGELYWGVNYLYYLGDVYRDQYYEAGNGEGNFFYPGTPQRIGGKTHIPIESIRLKLKREGLEDYEYLVLLDKLGGHAFAENEAAQLVTSAVQWETNPAALYRVRSEVASQIEILSSRKYRNFDSEAPVTSESD